MARSSLSCRITFGLTFPSTEAGGFGRGRRKGFTIAAEDEGAAVDAVVDAVEDSLLRGRCLKWIQQKLKLI